MAIALVGTILAAVLLLLVVLAVARGRDWRTGSVTDHEATSLVEAATGNPLAWVAAFLLLALGLPAVAIVAVGGFGLSVPGAVTAALAAFALVVVVYLVGGTYAAVRDRQGSPALATLVVSLLLGVLLVVAISGTLLMG